MNVCICIPVQLKKPPPKKNQLCPLSYCSNLTVYTYMSCTIIHYCIRTYMYVLFARMKGDLALDDLTSQQVGDYLRS